MNHRLVLTAAFALALTMGCSSADAPADADDELDLETAVSAVQTCENEDGNPEDCDGPAKGAFALTAFNPANGQLSGFNQKGVAINAIVNNQTKFHKANLNRFIPTEPLRPLLLQYNAALQQGQGYAQLATLVSSGATARLRVNGNGVVKGFRPVPAR